MKVIFLDFDGVVVHAPTEREKVSVENRARMVHALKRDAVARLNRIVAATGAKVVISSSWRRHQSHEHLVAYLDRAGFQGEVIDETPILDAGNQLRFIPRGFEISLWLHWHPEVVNYVVLDDDFDFEGSPPEKWVQIPEGWDKGGLQDEHVERAIGVLNG